MMQHKISNWLKGIAIFLAIFGLLFLIGVTVFAFIRKDLHPVSSIIGFPLFTWYTLAICYFILFQFWKVCKEIGNDNSFSMENVSAFHRMSVGGIFLAIGFAVKLGVIYFLGELPLLYGLFIICEVIVSIVFVILCKALSKLILNAYEMKQENELTI